MMALRDLIIREEAPVREEALCFLRLLEKISARTLITCAKDMKEDHKPKQTLRLQAFVHIHQSRPLRLKMKEPEELELSKKTRRRNKKILH